MRALTHADDIDALVNSGDLMAAMRERTARIIADHTPADAMPAQACQDRVPMRDGRLCTYCWTDHTPGGAA